MWTRSELKTKAKQALSPNYWKAVLVSLIVAFVASDGGSNVSGSISGMFNGILPLFTGGRSTPTPYNEESYIIEDSAPALGVVFSVIALGFAVFLIIILIALAMDIFLFKPLEIGCRRYFLTALDSRAEIKDVCYTFDKNYKNGVKIMFFRDLFIFLWSLLFFIPGIIKTYEYRMIPYLLAENPHIDKDAAFEASRTMMSGNKWRAFVLDLSFIGWHILGLFTFGLLNIFYVGPYENLTRAALYQKLKGDFHTNMTNAIDVDILKEM